MIYTITFVRESRKFSNCVSDGYVTKKDSAKAGAIRFQTKEKEVDNFMKCRRYKLLLR
ncbi:MAG: hypothetical protein IKR58_02885 [Lachnospiraceae bacterium]|nr:hypothetical protein [Lachnospiraceae bacterium]